MPSNEGLMRLMNMVSSSSSVVVVNGQKISFNELSIKKTSDGGIVLTSDSIPIESVDNLVINISIVGNIDSLVLGTGTVSCNGNINSIQTGSGDISCEQVKGNINTTSGDIECNDVYGNINTVSGDVECGNISGSVNTISGDIKR